MSDPNDPTTIPAGPAAALSDEPIPGDTSSTGWGESSAEPAEPAAANQWLTQLQKMIDDIATQAAPVARQIGAKAAELAAVAAQNAGPALHKAADVTTDVGQKLADRAQKLATDLRAHAETDATATDGSSNGHTAESSEGTAAGSGTTSA